MAVVLRHFPPEFVNRIDETVVFHPLRRAQIRDIAGLQLQSLNTRLAEKELRLDAVPEVLDHIAEAGYDPVYGARPLKRAIQTHIENPLAQEMLKGNYTPGDTIQATLNPQGHLHFTKTPAAASA